jgi:hypothetical protein
VVVGRETGKWMPKILSRENMYKIWRVGFQKTPSVLSWTLRENNY